MTKFSYSEVQPAYTSSQSARLSSLSSFTTVETTIEQFAGSTRLTGPGWDSAKQALAPYSVISKALYNYYCDFGETFARFLASFESEVGETSKTLDTEELADLQAKINRLQHEKQDLMQKIAGNIALEIIGGYGVMYQDFQIDQKQKKVDLLQKYEAFENNHANDFSEIKAIGTQLKTALSDLGTAKQFNPKTGKYSKIEYTNYDWYQKLSDYNDNDSRPSQRMEIVEEHKEAAGHGLMVYKVYINGKYNEEASTNLQWLMLQDSVKMVVDVGGELTGVYDLYRLFFGKDPVSGGAASRLEAGLWTALLLLPTGKLVEGIKEIKAGNRLLKGMDLTADELRILNKAGYFEDVAKIEKINGVKNFKFDRNSKNHLKNVEKVTTKKGIVGGHNMDEFNKALKQQGFNPEDLIISKTPHPTIDGIYEIEYKIPKKDITGKVEEPVTFKKIKEPKTVYDPVKISDEKIYQWGQEAMYNGEIDGRMVEGTASNGLKYRGYLNEFGEITNFYPILD